MKASIDKAAEHASMTLHPLRRKHKLTPPAHLHQQLLDLDALASEVEATQLAAELEELQAAEDLKFETYAQSRRYPSPSPSPPFPPASSKHPRGGNRAELAIKKQEYANQLTSFERERISVLSEELSSSIPPPRKPLKKTQTGLESVTITSEDAGGELEDFFGGGESSGVSSQPDTVVQKKEKSKAKTAGRRTEVPVRGRRPVKANPHLGVMEDEDIEEGRKWY